MGRLGEFLFAQGAISRGELEEAVRFQAVYGGRLGTCLVDLGYLALEELAAYLSDYTGAPLPPVDWAEQPDENAIQVVPMPLIRRLKVLPLRLEKQRLHVAMLDPCDPEQREFLSIAAERPVEPYVLPERRLLQLLESQLGVDRHPRFLGMLTRPRRSELSEAEAESATPLLRARDRARAAEALAATRPEGVDAAAPGPPPEPPVEEILLLDELVAAGDAPAPSAPDATLEQSAPERGTSSGVAHLEAELYAGGDRDEIVRLGLRLARVYACAAALFVVRSGVVTGFRASGRGMDPSMAGIEIPLEAPSLLTHPVRTRMPFRGAPPEDGIDGRLLAALGRAEVQEVFVHTVVLRDRTVNLLYADNGPDAFGETSIAALTALCGRLAGAYARLIAAGKRGG